MLATELAALYARDLTRLIEEIRAFPDRDTLWKTAPGVTNSAGNEPRAGDRSSWP